MSGSQGAMIAAQIADGGEVVLPAGTVVLPSIPVPSNTRIVGAGEGVTNIVSSEASVFTAAAPNVVNITIEGITFLGNPGAPAGRPISFAGTDAVNRPSNLTFRSIQVIGFATAIFTRLCANIMHRDVFAIDCTNGVWSDTCADVNMDTVVVQHAIGAAGNTGPAITVLNDGLHGACDEGLRINGCSSNGQASGLYVSGQHWASMTNYSFSTCSNNAVVLSGASSWQIGVGQIAPAAQGFASLILDSGCSGIAINGMATAGGSFGLVLLGRNCSVNGGHHTGNQQPDIFLGASSYGTTISGVRCCSTGVPVSIQNVGIRNLIAGNVVSGSIASTGAGSVVGVNLGAA